jgi:hypothetical protein
MEEVLTVRFGIQRNRSRIGSGNRSKRGSMKSRGRGRSKSKSRKVAKDQFL